MLISPWFNIAPLGCSYSWHLCLSSGYPNPVSELISNGWTWNSFFWTVINFIFLWSTVAFTLSVSGLVSPLKPQPFPLLPASPGQQAGKNQMFAKVGIFLPAMPLPRMNDLTWLHLKSQREKGVPLDDRHFLFSIWTEICLSLKQADFWII